MITFKNASRFPWLMAAVMVAAGGCASTEVEEEAVAAASAAQSEDGYYADNLPPELLTKLYVEKGTLNIDARDKRMLFPMPRKPRSFKSHDELVSYAVKTLGATKVPVKKQGDWGFTIKTLQMGDSYWIDGKTELIYRVADPAMAYLGGSTGRVLVAGKPVCLDGRQSCESGLAAYLIPDGEKTAPSDLDVCREPMVWTDPRFCAHYHSFFNKVDLCVFKYARHGGNTRLTVNHGGTVIRIRSIRACSEGEPGAFDLGAWTSGGERHFWVCTDWELEELPPGEHSIAVRGPQVGGDAGSGGVEGGSTTSDFIESAVVSATGGFCAPDTIETAARWVCDSHSLDGAFNRTTGNGPLAINCGP